MSAIELLTLVIGAQGERGADGSWLSSFGVSIDNSRLRCFCDSFTAGLRLISTELLNDQN